MPKYYPFKVYGYYLYYTSFCIIECMHVHASDTRLSESGSRGEMRFRKSEAAFGQAFGKADRDSAEKRAARPQRT